MHCSEACTWAAPSLPQASAPQSTRSPSWHPTYWYPDTAPAGEHNTPSPPRYPTAGSKAAAALATSSPLPYAIRERGISGRGHVDEAAVVTLERHRHGRGRAVPVLGDDQVRLAGPRGLPLVCVLAVQQDHDVRVLLYTIVQVYPVCHEIM